MKINFPANTKNSTGYVKVKYVRVIIDYTVPNFAITANKVEGEYINDDFKVQVNISNVNRTNNDPNVTIKLPDNVSYVSKEGDGNVTVSSSSLVWKPGLSKKSLNKTAVLILSVFIQ